MNPVQRIVRNSVFGVLSQAVGGGIMFLVALLSARYLSPGHFGVFSFSFAMVTVVQMFAGGLTNILVREIARDLNKLEYILGAMIPLMTLLSALVWLFVFVCVSFSSVDTDTSTTIYILTAAFPMSFHSAVYAAVCRAHEEMIYNALALVLQRLVLLCSILLTLLFDLGLPGVALSYLAAHVAQWLYFSILVSRRYCQYRPRLDLRLWKHMMLEGTPMAFGMMMQRIASYADIFMLALLSTASSVGLFSAAYRLVEMLSIIPSTLSHPLFPALSRAAVESAEAAFSLYLKAQKFLVIIGLPLGFWVFVTAPQLITVLFGPKYTQAGASLRVLGLMLALLFMNSLYLYLFSALGEQRRYMITMSLMVLLNIILDLFLIPAFDIFGAALATITSELALYVIGTFLLVRRGLQVSKLLRLWRVLPALLIGAVMLIWPVYSPSLHSLLLGTIGFGLVYLVAIYNFKLMGMSELKTLWSVRPQRGVRDDNQSTCTV